VLNPAGQTGLKRRMRLAEDEIHNISSPRCLWSSNVAAAATSRSPAKDE
jgi:hypothetical protein